MAQLNSKGKQINFSVPIDTYLLLFKAQVKLILIFFFQKARPVILCKFSSKIIIFWFQNLINTEEENNFCSVKLWMKLRKYKYILYMYIDNYIIWKIHIFELLWKLEVIFLNTGIFWSQFSACEWIIWSFGYYRIHIDPWLNTCPCKAHRCVCVCVCVCVVSYLSPARLSSQWAPAAQTAFEVT